MNLLPRELSWTASGSEQNMKTFPISASHVAKSGIKRSPALRSSESALRRPAPLPSSLPRTRPQTRPPTCPPAMATALG
ncbi:hypothetical protein LINPERHAP1_LOCUS36369 [Linum perenne]